MVRNSFGWRQWLGRLQGLPIEFNLLPYEEALVEINGLEEEVRPLSDNELEARARRLRSQVQAGESRDRVRPVLFALVREAGRRTLGLRPHDEQVVAALALDRGSVVEMQTGEGKTLAAVMPAALNALTGEGVHVLTFNDYLARRDAEWMAPIYRMLGVSVGFVQQGMTSGERRRAYSADVTYVTAKEAGFDHLRDLLAMNTTDLVHRQFHFALVDEADSLMIDEARVPLVIAGSIARTRSLAPRLVPLVASLSPGVHYDTDEYGRDVELTDAGIEHVERSLACGSLHEERNLALLTELNCALHARVLLRRDVDYIVRDGRIEIVDEFTGRVITDRHWPDGLQAAIEAKEGLESRADGRVLGSMTLQRFLSGYPRLCGMTGTACDAASEFQAFYGLDVVVIPTHFPLIRLDRPDVVFSDRDAKEKAVVEEVKQTHASGRPVLVGTLTVEESERLAERLRLEGVTCEVLNAKNDEKEARIVASAGALGAITISTNMAGRGTDIRLGGEQEAARERVAALGGLYVIGTNRHETRRVDLQLRGRAGRQGDPGESRCFISLEDDLLVRYGVRGLIPARVLPTRSDEPIDNPVVNREIARAQRIIEGQDFEIRRTLSRYASVVEEQHSIVMERRQGLLCNREGPEVWQREPVQRAALVAAVGEEAVRRGEQVVKLACIDREWRDHLARCADLREGIHLVRLSGQDPLTRFTSEVIRAFSGLEEAVDEGVLDALKRVKVATNRLDLTDVEIKGPSSTWTYLVNDDPFRNQIGMMLTGAGRTTVAIYSAAILWPLLLVWGIVDRFVRRRATKGTKR